MNHAALQLSDEVDALIANGESWDVLVTTDMLDVAAFRSIVNQVVRELPLVAYFHENQFVYPTKAERKHDSSFAFTNMTTALAADQAWFNSRHNLDSMLEQIRGLKDILPAASLENTIGRILATATIHYPGIDLPPANRRIIHPSQPIHLVWAARWEHDKNPVGLLKTLDHLAARNLDFRISVIGQNFEVIPRAFSLIEQKYGDRIANWGYVPTRHQYWQVLASGDVFVSTAEHEFFGLSVVEAISAGVYPLLPNRLSYPEVLNIVDHPERAQFLYARTPANLADKLEEICRDRSVLASAARTRLTNHVHETFGWAIRAREMDEALVQLVRNHQRQSRFGPVP
jgi:glycosyltransferase involved in cell wall biosynthesis